MSTTEISSRIDEQKFSQAELLQDLDAGGPLTAADYQNQMDAMFGELKANRGTDIWAARAEVWDRYVTNGPQGPINTFSQVMLRGSYDDHYEGVKAQCEDVLKHPATWSPLEVRDAQAAIKEAKSFLVESNNLLRDVIEDQGDEFTNRQFINWYTTACEGNANLVEGRVMGAAAEIAVKQAMEAMGVFRNGTVQYGDTEQDLHGMDVVGQIKKGGEWIAVDAKAGKQMPSHRREKYGIHLTVGVPSGLFDQHYKVDQQGTDGLAYLINLELNKTKHSASHHAVRQGSVR